MQPPESRFLPRPPVCYTAAMDADRIKALAVRRAKELGFVAAGVAAAGRAPHAEALEQWLAEGRHASMDYMARHVAKRCDVRVEWPWAKSVLCLASSYAVDEADSPPSALARYARARDYHKVLKRRCHQLADDLTQISPGFKARACVDTAPILERDWAAAAGIGWVGANGCLIHPEWGSYLLLAEIVVSIKLPADEPLADQCGDCRLCIDACPNGALTAPRMLDSRRCNSWATIENRGDLDGDAFDTRGSVFGCDLCQEACPHNRNVTGGVDRQLVARRPIAEVDPATILGWSQADWDAATRGSATRRASYEMFLRNAAVAVGRGEASAEVVEQLRRLAEHPAPIVRHASLWALGRLDGANRR